MSATLLTRGSNLQRRLRDEGRLLNHVVELWPKPVRGPATNTVYS
jgi:hypothetical protein